MTRSAVCKLLVPVVLSVLLPFSLASIDGTKPHIIFILADDLGFNDVGYNAVGSEILTPNIDDLADQGVKLDNYYVMPQCTPTRGTLLTGRYQIHTGLQHNIIGLMRPYCLPLTETTMADKLKDAGYATHMVGKWHLGMYTYDCTPTYRGFDSFLGFYAEGGEYYTHEQDYVVESKGINVTGYDFRDGEEVAWDYAGTYSTYAYDERAQEVIRSHNPSEPLFLYVAMQAPHSPLEVDQAYKALYRTDSMKGLNNRKTLAGMISCMDEAIGNIVDALKETGLYDNSVIVFSSDNGAPTSYGNNWPLRGGKNSLFEGGVRTVGFVHSPLLPADVQQTTSNAMIHVSDWFPTFVDTLAGEDVSGLELDGVSVWNAIFDGTASDRTEILHNIDHLKTNGVEDTVNSFDTSIQAALTKGDWKIITGTPGADWDWTAPLESDIASIPNTDDSSKTLWLFNITSDPFETNDLSTSYPDVVDELLDRLADYYDGYVTPINPSRDAGYDPADYGGVWEPWG